MKAEQMRVSPSPSKGLWPWLPAVVLAAACGWALTLQAWGKDKITPEELVARHLDSIGTAEARAAFSNLVATGDASVIPRLGGSGRIDGGLRMTSAPDRCLIYMKFDNPNYPREGLLFDGDKADVAFIKPGQRSPLGQFLYTQDMPLKEGLIAGTLSRDWPLLNLEENNPRLKYRGLRKRDNEKYHELEYRARKGRTDLTIRLYFEQDTYRHVQTEYRMSIAAGMGSRPEESSQQSETRFKLVEEFSDFRQENGLTLPHQYVIHYDATGNSTLRIDWEMRLQDFQFNQPLEGAFQIP